MPPRSRARRTGLAFGVPAALVGSLALSAAPAAAAPAGVTPAARTVPAQRPAVAASGDVVHQVVAGDTVWAIARRYGVEVDAILAANALARASIIRPGQRLAIPAVGGATPTGTAAVSPSGLHVVRAGDTITAIARRQGTTVAALLAANGLVAASIIYPGQTLRLPAGSVGTPTGLDAEQTANATRIIAIGRELGVPDRGIAIALGTAMQESWLRNLPYGDRDSLGLFQQRPRAGWGSAAQVRDVDRAIRVFFGGPRDPNGARTRGLLDIPGWQRMSFAQAAQAVQNSAYPARYAQWEQPAAAWLAALG